ncbi:potassium channel family protein [Nocardia thailandica]|uniref:potassium channel family protein n=1 Tax=Nocardia thailandica TaxID=257275 RepID=UPI0002E5B4F8|nr:potassium channel family protein [Nocardia thailandica]
MTDQPRRSTRVRNLVAGVVCALLFFYGVPLRWDIGGDNIASQILALICFLIGLGGLIWLIARRIRHYLRDPEAMGSRIDSILLLVFVAVVFFAQFYYRLEIHDPAEFSGLATRTDSLYYTVVTLGTVGYGDVHATGQVARIATMAQIAFDLVIIGTLLTIFTSALTRRLERAADRAAAAKLSGATDTTR